MVRLKTLKPVLPKVPPPLGHASGELERDRHRDATQPWRAWYKTARWGRLSKAIKVRDLFTCQMCGRLCTAKGEAVADHITPHRGDETLFWNAANLQCLCKGCHDSAKQREDRGGRMARADGWRP